jgi:LuxR family maltose regulon positive regulatory protein
LSLEEEDNDAVRFLTYLIAALQVVDSRIGQTALAQLDPLERTSLNSQLVLLLNDIAGLPERLYLVLNDYHVVHKPAIHHALTFMLDHLPPQLHLIITTREEPPLPLHSLRASGQISELGLRHLRFAGEETTAFLNQTMGLNLSAEAIQTLESRTEGWIAGLQMAALSLREQGTSGTEDSYRLVRAFGAKHRYVIDYVAHEVLNQQSAERRAFLRQTAILDRLCASLCDAVTGQADSQDMLAELERANLFLIPLDDEGQWYRYHDLFAEFLRGEVGEADRGDQGPHSPNRLHQRASEWFEAHGFLLRRLNMPWLRTTRPPRCA